MGSRLRVGSAGTNMQAKQLAELAELPIEAVGQLAAPYG